MHIPAARQRILAGHQGAVHVAKYNSTGVYCLSGGQDRSIVLWNATTGSAVRRYAAHGWQVLDLAVGADSSRFVSGGGDKTVFLWDVATGQTTRRFAGHFARVNTVAFGSDDGAVVASGSYDTTVRLWDARSGARAPVQVLEDATDSVSSLDIAGAEILAGSVDGRVRAYDIRQGLLTVDTLGPAVGAVMFSADRGFYLASTLDSAVRLIDRSDGALLQTFRGHRNSEYRLRAVLAAHDEQVYAASEDGCVYVWRVADAAVLARAAVADGGVVSSVDVHPTTGQFLASCNSGAVEVWA